MKYLSIFFCLLCYSTHSQECNYTLSGTIIDFHDGTKIKDASVYIEQINMFTTSNFNGVFTFSDLCKGEYTITMSHIN